VESIPTSGNKEDFVSMGWLAAVKAAQVADRLATILALEFLCATQGLDFLRPLRPARSILPVIEMIRGHVTHLEADRSLRPDLDRVLRLLDDGSLLAVVETDAGPLA
jgi:histidine ammonia-lyase